MRASQSSSGAGGRTAALISPVVDFLSVGGLSLLFLVPLLVSGRSDLVLIGAGAQAWIATALNMPHFLASYRLVYRSRESILKHKWASLYVPIILFAYTVIALWEAQSSPVLVIVLITVSSMYLAWHYTGQAWGMMASFAYLGGRPFDATERTLIRTSLRVLLAWHLAWFLYTQLRDPSRVLWLYQLASAATVVAIALGGYGLWRSKRRTGAWPPFHALVAWIAIFVWYAAMARDPKALFWVQIAHAIQYLAFPIRVELNSQRDPEHAPHAIRHMVAYGVILAAASYLMSRVVPVAAMGAVGKLLGEEPSKSAPIVILMFINIHHYFTDGVIWKISNPEVRRELFAHVASRGVTDKRS